MESTHTAADIEALVKSVGDTGVIEDASTQLLTAAIQFRDTSVTEVMAPRPDLVALPITATPGDFEETVVATGHSRIPVYGDTLEDIAKLFIVSKDDIIALNNLSGEDDIKPGQKLLIPPPDL